ncbi:MAG: hypothetical protein JNN15_12255 [Blastocatellia bacterium]|nr:hypothetical protein [Blastocatellia bacterium]
MITRQTMIVRQLVLIGLAVAFLTVGMLFTNLYYLSDRQLRAVDSQLAFQQYQIFTAIQMSVNETEKKISSEKDIVSIVKSSQLVQTSLRDSLKKIENTRYAVVFTGSGELVSAVSVGRITDGFNSDEKDFKKLLEASPVTQIFMMLFSRSNYFSSLRVPIFSQEKSKGIVVEIRLGIPASTIRVGLRNIVVVNLSLIVIGMLVATLAAIRSADTLTRPVEVLVDQIEKLERGDDLGFQEEKITNEMPQSITSKLQMLSKRLAGERTELETTRGRLTQIIDKIEERLLLLNPDKRVMLMSPKVDHILGVAGIDLLGGMLEDRLGRNHPLIELVNKVSKSKRSAENMMIFDQNDPRQVLASVQYIEDKGEPIGMLVSLRDFDSFKQFKSQLDYSDKLAALGRITSGVAHEVKNPLNAMVIHLEILRAKLNEPNADVTPQIEILSSEIKRLDRVVQTFLNFTRPLHINLVPIDLNDLVHQVTRLAAAEAAAHKVDLCEDLCADYIKINGDSDLLKQTFLNIIINGCQAMPQGGPLQIRTSRVGNYAEITISDRGVGIPPEFRDKIFNLYYTTKEKGNGIGLAQAFRAVQLHNGRIEFDSVIGVGTVFKILLPEV